MEFPQIRMHSQQAKIQIQTTPAQQQISQPQGELTIRQPKADIAMRTKPGKLYIDQSQAWEDMNLFSIRRVVEKNAQQGVQGALQGTARRARQGNELMRIEDHANPLKSQSIENGFSSKKSLGLAFIPSAFAVKTNYEPAHVDIHVQVNQPVIKGKINPPVMHYTPGSVKTSMAQWPQLDIEVVNKKV